MQCFLNDIVSYLLIIGYDFCLGVGNKFSNFGIGLVDRTECRIVRIYFVSSDTFEVDDSRSKYCAACIVNHLQIDVQCQYDLLLSCSERVLCRYVHLWYQQKRSEILALCSKPIGGNGRCKAIGKIIHAGLRYGFALFRNVNIHGYWLLLCPCQSHKT